MVCGFTMDDWNNAGGTGVKIIYGRCGFFATMVQKYLQEQADAGTPVVDSDGKYMQLDLRIMPWIILDMNKIKM